MRIGIIGIGALALSGCMTAAPSVQEQTTGEYPARPPEEMCDAGAAQSFVGHRASGETGAAILSASKARTLRWGPPNSAWTMDYREDRVNVRYDAGMTITDVTCG